MPLNPFGLYTGVWLASEEVSFLLSFTDQSPSSGTPPTMSRSAEGYVCRLSGQAPILHLGARGTSVHAGLSHSLGLYTIQAGPLTTPCGSPVLPTLLVHCLSFSRRIQAASSPWHHLDNFLVKIDLSLPNLLATFTMALTCRIMNSDQFNLSHSLLSTLLLEPPPFSTGWWLHWGILAQSHTLQSLF